MGGGTRYLDAAIRIEQENDTACVGQITASSMMGRGLFHALNQSYNKLTSSATQIYG